MRKKLKSQESIHFLLLISLFGCNFYTAATQIVNKSEEVKSSKLEALLEKPKKETVLEKIIEPKIDESTELQTQKIVEPKELSKREKRLLKKRERIKRKKERQKNKKIKRKARSRAKKALIGLSCVGGVVIGVVAIGLVGLYGALVCIGPGLACQIAGR